MRLYPGSYYFNRKTAEGRRRLRSRYSKGLSVDACHAEQLIALNEAWQSSLSQSDWAVALKEQFNLPDQFQSWDAFREQVPVMDKSMLRKVISSVSSLSSGVTWMATGGTTGEPFRFPISGQENVEARINMAWFRQAFGIGGGARLFLLWGHSHLLGSGVSGLIQRGRRQLSDRLMGYRRVSAYDLSDQAMLTAGDSMAEFRPDCFIGYTRAIERFVSVNAHRQSDFESLKLVQPTGEGYSSDEARVQVEAFFQAPVRMEYGTIETGPIAYQIAENLSDATKPVRFKPLWLSHHLERLADGSLTVTCLYQRALPLLRYRIGDFCEAQAPNLLLERISGRVNDVIEVGGTNVHSELISHAVRHIVNVTGYQVVVARSGAITLRLLAPNGLSEAERKNISEGLGKVEPELKDIQLVLVESLSMAKSGKRPLVVRE